MHLEVFAESFWYLEWFAPNWYSSPTLALFTFYSKNVLRPPPSKLQTYFMDDPKMIFSRSPAYVMPMYSIKY